MAAEPLKTLFYPFEAEALPLPRKEARVLFLGAEPGFRLPEGFDAALHLVQGFRPHFRALQASGYTVTPRVEGQGYDMALVLAGRHRGQNELRIAEALERVAPGGLIAVAGGKDDGTDSLRKRINALAPLEGHLPKHHGVAFWFRRAGTEAAETLRAGNPDLVVGGGFKTAPGMFSFDRIDAGSKLLAASLPDDLKGNIADLCAGWGYLAAEVLQRSQSLTTLDLYEADFEALEAARLNVRGAIEPRFFWIDLLTEAVDRRYDAIVMNPPFHSGRAAEPGIGAGMIRAASKALKPGGRLFMVANRQLPYEQVLSAAFASHTGIARDGMFKVLSARR
ncbi:MULTISPECIES: class I SAM-dependent methyltransferase [unclassified Mesorhizobium]|uniref:class I SAM-dependent methyltransferase n=1 Tax=unclassified Mesorhizobium TaxID=325217 RepID=UPI000F759E8D|nr:MULTISPECIES: class I SAM-dependent methyltransferase [unclassified Mesorhizobium]AZO05287.1 class I SAM-dependent methyltransferase [Mesorhizobium sp. M2A.F.Ca.ET.043.02.1.1]RUW41832.1 class I SAM-dependent methyltransferase [Mesorhizobium sp. M2A.F.Ca.ET.015.02.1.1]RUW80087.1 class I SAM-dependent methyltransferase [Mesorhizobium sp. M2A.F.Ca.ET.067.02.1.1]RVC95466.1 class I SAM-dependent methyltransferase [Mesorhizobium sp. M2A.F.Ca.ET.017.03.2.1]RVD11020.1 class I SAM-dependent methyltr